MAMYAIMVLTVDRLASRVIGVHTPKTVLYIESISVVALVLLTFCLLLELRESIRIIEKTSSLM
jgi:hypothetical protein